MTRHVIAGALVLAALAIGIIVGGQIAAAAYDQVRIETGVRCNVTAELTCPNCGAPIRIDVGLR